MLNKYFLYLKNSNIEYRELMELKLKNMLNPIKEKWNTNMDQSVLCVGYEG